MGPNAATRFFFSLYCISAINIANSFFLSNVVNPSVSVPKTSHGNLMSLQSIRINSEDNAVGISDVLTNSALVGGTTVGAGILALPTYAGESGFWPATAGLVGCWVFMLTTGLLVAEVCSNLVKYELSDTESSTKVAAVDVESIGILYMMQRTLGNSFAPISGGLYLFIHYALLVAYISEAGEILADTFSLPVTNYGLGLFTFIMGSLIAFNSEETVEKANNFFVAIVLTSFFILIGIGIPHIQLSGLQFACADRIRECLPIFLIALVYHNIIPVVANRLRYDKAAITQTLVIGTAIPLLMFILWTAVVLGVSGNAQAVAQLSSGNVQEQLIQMFSTASGSASTVNIGVVIDIFSEFAIITSFIGFVTGLVSFYGDVFPDKFRIITSENVLPLYSLILVPPFLIACADPSVFLQALDITGTFGISLLFGLIPPIMTKVVR